MWLTTRSFTSVVVKDSYFSSTSFSKALTASFIFLFAAASLSIMSMYSLSILNSSSKSKLYLISFIRFLMLFLFMLPLSFLCSSRTPSSPLFSSSNSSFTCYFISFCFKDSISSFSLKVFINNFFRQ